MYQGSVVYSSAPGHPIQAIVFANWLLSLLFAAPLFDRWLAFKARIFAPKHGAVCIRIRVKSHEIGANCASEKVRHNNLYLLRPKCGGHMFCVGPCGRI
jgi:hypothetical protein